MINPGIFFLFILLVAPGFLALRVFNCLIIQSKDKDSFWDITYSSVIHSIFIYIILYPLVYLIGIDILSEEAILEYLETSRWMPLKVVLIIVLISILYGSAYAVIYRFEILSKILKVFFKKTVEPPNILADIIDPKYGTEPMEHWLTFKLDGVVLSGGVRIARLDIEPKEFLLENVRILDPNTREALLEYPKDQYVWVKIDDNITLLELKSVSKNCNDN